MRLPQNTELSSPQSRDTQKLLKDPEYQISSLCFMHSIEKNCNAHLLASAFPNLTEFVLHGISNSDSPKKTKASHRRRLRKNGSLVSEEHSDAWNTDSSFKMLVENTPRLEVLEISPNNEEDEFEIWDLDALYLISGWKNLRVIHLYNVPMSDAKFLIDIAKGCRKLEEVALDDFSCFQACYENELLQMLKNCSSLRKLNIQIGSLERLSEVFEILSNRSRLVALDSRTYTRECDLKESMPVITWS